MGNFREELGVILDLLEEWCRKSGASYVSASVSTGEYGVAWDQVDKESRFDVFRDYEKAETPGGSLDGKE